MAKPGKTKIKAKLKKGIVTVKAMAKHSMLSYAEAKNASKKKKKDIPANFITYITAKVDGKIVYEVSTSQFLSKNPYFKFAFKGGNKGDKVEITWTDLSGATQTSTGKIK
jgi:sulfur-oxidizing protein SoxZ